MRKAQSLGEYSVCIACIVLAITAIQVYVNRGLQGRYADLSDAATDRLGSINQYEPYYIDSQEVVSENRTLGQSFYPRGKIEETIGNDIKLISERLSIEGINPYKYDDE